MLRLFLWTIALITMPVLWAAPWRPLPDATAKTDTLFATGSPDDQPRWRRTTNGWEDARTWATTRRTFATHVEQPVASTSVNFAAHPLVFTAWLLLLSIAAMKTWPANPVRSPIAPIAPQPTIKGHESAAF